ncbi:AI-2E family transporter [Oerskovia flava]|uniref:AI-2E family transporter n=1 Tax=Oerskovia flava TaxID=2986422 RepID=UPI00223F9643|nr:AI-2E family transporter [Oerskovia sp. JB1-3-2]
MTSEPGASAPPPTTLAPATRTVLTLAAAVVLLAGLHAANEIVAPMLLAAVIVIICHPVRFPLEARGWPRWAATTVVVVVAYLILAALLAMLVFAGFQFADLVREYLPQLRSSVLDGVDALSALGIDTDLAATATAWLEPSRVLALAGDISGTVLGIATALFFVLAYAIFMAADAARYSTASRVFGSSRADEIGRATRFSSGVRRYFVVNASFGAVVAVIDGIALAMLGVPAPVVWAILAFVTNFVPNIGFVLGLVPPAIMAFVVGGWPLALAVVAIYCLVNVVLQVLVQPKFVADAVNLSLTLSFVSVVFWTFVIGPLGAILAIPLTLLVRAVLVEGDPRATWLRWLSGDAVPPAARPAASSGDPHVAEPDTDGENVGTTRAGAVDRADGATPDP